MTASPDARPRGRPRADRGLQVRTLATLVAVLTFPTVVAAGLVFGVTRLAAPVLLGLVVLGAFADLLGRRRLPATSELTAGEAPAVHAALERLCVLADVPKPRLVLVEGRVANTWTADGAIHLNRRLLHLLDDDELELVLAHELAHVLHGDVAVMAAATGASATMLAAADATLHLRRDPYGAVAAAVLFPIAWSIGWASRLLSLSLSRAREFAADATAAQLTGRPAALAATLLRLSDALGDAPQRDLRLAEGRSALGIVGVSAGATGRLLHSHPPVRARVERLERLEAQLQGAPRA